MNSAAGRYSAMLVVSSLASFLASFLLFALEPFIGKILLPAFGGTPLLWNTCMVFFQVALLAGYLYALLLTRHVAVGVQVGIQGLLLVSLFVIYPDARHVVQDIGSSPGANLAWWLTRHVLPAFMVLAAFTTLLQSWYAQSMHSTVSPYRLYAASNAGSLAGLFAYPLLIEPTFSLSEQRNVFLLVAVPLVLAVSTLSALMRSRGLRSARPSAEGRPSLGEWHFDWPRIIVLTAIPSSLLLGVTNYLLTDIASLPLFWVIPLVLYLASFIIAFSGRFARAPDWLNRAYAMACILVVILISLDATSPAKLLIPLHLLVFATGCLLSHVRVAAAAPAPEFLPQFYLAVSVGGALGGVVTLLVPPMTTTRMIEYPAALALSTIVLVAVQSAPRSWMRRLADAVLPFALVVAATSAVHAATTSVAAAAPWLAMAYVPAALFVLNANTGGTMFTTRLLGLFAASLFLPTPYGRTLFADRTFFGRVRVTYDPVDNEHVLIHGSTVHGVQRVAKMDSCTPTTYFHPSGPAGRLLTGLPSSATPRRVALVGLGAGALTCYAREGESWDLFELDPVVARIAGDPKLFTFLQHSKAAGKRVTLGDARLALDRESAARYQVIIIDAFSSDAIPIHLLTREALEGYARVLSSDGIMLFHVTNRFFRLEPVLAAVAPTVGFEARLDADAIISAADSTDGKYPSKWVALVRTAQLPVLDTHWRQMRNAPVRVWTDDYSNPLSALGFLQAQPASARR